MIVLRKKRPSSWSREQVFWSMVDKESSPHGCWLWTSGLKEKGYGSFWVGGKRKTMSAHRFSYQLAFGPVPAGFQIDHKCRIHSCVNPAHLEAVTSKENCYRGESFAVANSLKTHCPQGHAYTEDNIYRTKTNGRACKTCVKKRAEENRPKANARRRQRRAAQRATRR